MGPASDGASQGPSSRPASIARVALSANRLDAWLLARTAGTRYAILALTIAAIVWQALPFVPRPVADFSTIPGLRHLHQPETFGTDTIADVYESRVVVHDVADMYTKREVDQAPLEARTWSKTASSPYPPAVLLVDAGLFALAGRSEAGYYLAILCLAAVFLGLSLIYFLQTRWYLFPLLYLNFSYLGYRFAGVQDGTYVVMLVLIVAALLLARRRHQWAHILMALAIIAKLSPLYYTTELPRMRRAAAWSFAAILLAGLVLPYFLWTHYFDIYTYGAALKGHPSSRIAAVLAAVPFAILVTYVESRARFDMEDRIGWGVLPFALFLAIRMNVARHLLLVLLVPDKRGWRNLAVAGGLALYTAAGGALPLGSILSIEIGLLVVILLGYVYAIGGATIRADLGRLSRPLTAPAR